MAPAATPEARLGQQMNCTGIIQRISGSTKTMSSRNEIFEATCRKEFSYLENFGFVVEECMNDNYGCRLTYKNTTTALRIDLERATIAVDCYKLQDGKIPAYAVFFDPNQEFLIFDLNDLLILRTGRKVEQDPKRMYDDAYMKEKIREFASLLRQHASDVLVGDFHILPQIKERVVRRAKELEHER